MRFDLDDTLVNGILFYMENQDGEYLFDTQECQIINIENDEIDEDNSDRYISLPQWTTNDGYRLMEKFTLNLKNPLLRAELTAALNKNKGVFRSFKSALEQHPETEKKWLLFKEKKMKNEVIIWYNSMREEWGLQPVGSEPEDTASLVLEDFLFKQTEKYCFTAETAGGEEAGIIKAFLENNILYIHNLEVKPEYRSMGIGKTLLSKLLEKADERKLELLIDVPEETGFFSRSLLLENFKPCMQRFKRDKNI